MRTLGFSRLILLAIPALCLIFFFCASRLDGTVVTIGYDQRESVDDNTALAMTMGMTAAMSAEHLCLKRTIPQLISDLNMEPLSPKKRLGETATIYVDPKRTIVFKKITGYHAFRPHIRESCVLQLLQPFAWAPKLICAREDLLVTTYMGEPMCREELQSSNDYMQQLDSIFTDLRSVGVKHNDLAKPGLKEILKLHDKLSLVDYGWATVDGKLDVECTLNGLKEKTPLERPHNDVLDTGFKIVENAFNVAPNAQTCPPAFVKYSQTGRDGRASQSEIPTLSFDKYGTYLIGGYHHFSVSSTGRVTVLNKRPKFLLIADLLQNLKSQYRCRSFIDVGANTGIVSFLASSAGFDRVTALDHDAAAVSIINQIATGTKLALNAESFDFGSKLPWKADVLYLGSLIHWVWCLTANFEGSFPRIIQYLFEYALKFVVIEFVEPDDAAILSFGHIERCTGSKPKLQYTVSNFEAAVMEAHGKIINTKRSEKGRMLYTIAVTHNNTL
jgi:hypothetical protein